MSNDGESGGDLGSLIVGGIIGAVITTIVSYCMGPNINYAQIISQEGRPPIMQLSRRGRDGFLIESPAVKDRFVQPGKYSIEYMNRPTDK